MYLSRATKNSEVHALNGNTPKTAALKAKGAKKATAKAAHGSALLKSQVVEKTVAVKLVPLETLVVDPLKCRARTWYVGAGRQCTLRPCADSKYCALHSKPGGLPHGTVDGEVEAAIQAKYDKASSHVLGAKGFDWRSRAKLWDEAQLLGKTPATLTDGEFQRALYQIDVFPKNTPRTLGNGISRSVLDHSLLLNVMMRLL